MIFNKVSFAASSMISLLLAGGAMASERVNEDSRDGYFGLNPVAPNMQHKVNTRSMWEDMNLYIIWYGQWAAADKAIITDFLGGLKDSDFWAIEQKYYQLYTTSSKVAHATPPNVKYPVTKNMKVGGQVDDAWSQGKALGTSGGNSGPIPKIVNTHIQKGNLPADTNGFYIVLGDAQTVEGNSCSSYCGYHTSTYGASTGDYVYTYVGNPAACGPNGVLGCGGQLVSPNGNAAVDAMLSPLAHELAEGGSNPDTVASGWNNPDGYENGDNCAYVYGSNRKRDSAGFYYNQEWNGRKYHIQQLWDPETQLCGPTIPANVPAECELFHSIFSNLKLGDDCCNSGYVDCASGHIDAIDVRSNGITGNINTLVANIAVSFPKLTSLKLGSFGGADDKTPNSFTGTFPAELCNIVNLETVNIKNLGLSGTIPDCFSALTSLQFVSIGGNKLAGGISEAVFADANKLRMLSVATTPSGTMALSGAIPKSLASKTLLTSLVLTGNAQLTGPVPSGFIGFGGKSVGATDGSGPVSLCDFTGTGLCLPTGYSGPLCGLTISSTCKAVVSTTTTTTTTKAVATSTKAVVTTKAPATTAANTCAHSVCTAGALLKSGCSTCVTAVCKADSYCCSNSWDSQCVSEVNQYCGAGTC
ncbi:UNVERIFIED_CONTAM: hypothetical protein HDU68_001308 [Siphonaria sp. JEL0065]|nr:hypothetical protein HDU68_001308 [Siphonaria sp. JEL0065]